MPKVSGTYSSSRLIMALKIILFVDGEPKPLLSVFWDKLTFIAFLITTQLSRAGLEDMKPIYIYKSKHKKRRHLSLSLMLKEEMLRISSVKELYLSRIKGLDVIRGHRRVLHHASVVKQDPVWHVRFMSFVSCLSHTVHVPHLSSSLSEQNDTCDITSPQAPSPADPELSMKKYQVHAPCLQDLS